MKLIKASYQILTPINGEEILKAIELAARTCYQSEGKIEYEYADEYDLPDQYGGRNKIGEYIKTAKSARTLIPKLMNLNHEAMLEFGGMITVKFIVDRGVTHELVRHRMCSFAQESTRYCNYGKDEHITFIIPSWLQDKCKEREISRYEWRKSFDNEHDDWEQAMLMGEEGYNHMIKVNNWTPQQARSVLPNSLKSEINISANIREWRHIFKLRTTKAAHPQMREVMCPLLDEFKNKIPILFDDINY